MYVERGKQRDRDGDEELEPGQAREGDESGKLDLDEI